MKEINIVVKSDNTLFVPKKFEQFLIVNDFTKVSIENHELVYLKRICKKELFIESTKNIDTLLKIFDKKIILQAHLDCHAYGYFNKIAKISLMKFLVFESEPNYGEAPNVNYYEYLELLGEEFDEVYSFCTYKQKICYCDTYFWALLRDDIHGSDKAQDIINRYCCRSYSKISEVFMKIYDLFCDV